MGEPFSPQRFFVRCYIRVDPPDGDLILGIDEAEEDMKQAQLMQPENHYEVIGVDPYDGTEQRVATDLEDAALQTARTIHEYLHGVWDGCREGWECTWRALHKTATASLEEA